MSKDDNNLYEVRKELDNSICSIVDAITKTKDVEKLKSFILNLMEYSASILSLIVCSSGGQPEKDLPNLIEVIEIEIKKRIPAYTVYLDLQKSGNWEGIRHD